MAYSKKQVDVIEADAEYWHEFCRAIGWKLIGFDYRDHARIHTGIYCPNRAGFHITGAERDAIMATIERGGK